MMKNIFTKKLSLVAFLAAVMFFNACKFKDPLEGFVISVKTDAISAAHIFRVVDAKSGFSKSQFDNVVVKLSGPGAANLYDADGKKEFKIVEGRIGICIRKGVNPSVEKPVVFSMELVVPGYLSKIATYSLTSVMPTTNTIALVNENDLPSGTAKSDTTFTVPSTGTTQEISIAAATSSTKPEGATITLPAGTKFTLEDGTPASGTITTNLFHTLPKTAEDYAMSISAPFNTKFKDSTGKEVNYFLDEKEMIRLEFTSSGKTVQPVFPDINLGLNLFSSNKSTNKNEIWLFSNNNLSNGIQEINVVPFIQYRNPMQPAIWVFGGWADPYDVINLNYTITNYDVAGSNYQFRRAVFYTNPSSYLSSEEAIQPLPNGTFSVLSASYISGRIYEHKIQYKKVNETTWTDAPADRNIVLEIPAPNTFLKVYFAVVCARGDVERPVLNAGTNIYLIKENSYQSTPNPARGGALIYPEDNEVGGVKWKKYTVIGQETRNNRVWNVINIPWSDLEAGQEYRASYYRATKRQDNNVNDPSGKIFAPAANSISELEIEMNVANCD